MYFFKRVSEPLSRAARLVGMANIDSQIPLTKTILIVEDDPFIAMDLQDTFEDAGYTVLGPVAAVTPGLELVASEKPDAAMLDYNLGRENSLPIADRLDEKSVPYLFLSGQIDRVVCKGRMARDLLVAKPFNADALVARVNKMIDMSRKHTAKP